MGIESDLIELCEDNEEMKKALKDYFERHKEEVRAWRIAFDKLEKKSAKWRDLIAELELGKYDEWANGLFEFMQKSDCELSPKTIKQVVISFCEDAEVMRR